MADDDVEDAGNTFSRGDLFGPRTDEDDDGNPASDPMYDIEGAKAVAHGLPERLLDVGMGVVDATTTGGLIGLTRTARDSRIEVERQLHDMYDKAHEDEQPAEGPSDARLAGQQLADMFSPPSVFGALHEANPESAGSADAVPDALVAFGMTGEGALAGTMPAGGVLGVGLKAAALAGEEAAEAWSHRPGAPGPEEQGPFPDDGSDAAFRVDVSGLPVPDVLGEDVPLQDAVGAEPLIRPDPDAQPLLEPMHEPLPVVEPAPTLEEQATDPTILHTTPLPEPPAPPEPEEAAWEPAPPVEPSVVEEYVPEVVEAYVPEPPVVEEYVPDVVEEYVPDVVDEVTSYFDEG